MGEPRSPGGKIVPCILDVADDVARDLRYRFLEIPRGIPVGGFS